MNHYRSVLSLALVAIFSFPSAAQQVSPIVTQRDPEALSVIQKAIAAMGGPAAVAQVQSVVAQGTMAAAPDADAPTGNFTWEDQITLSGHEFNDTFQSGSGTQHFLSGHGSPGLVTNTGVRKFKPHVGNFRVPVHLPAVVLTSLLANPNCNIGLATQATLNGQTVVQIHLHIDTDMLQKSLSVQDWYFDPATGLPLRMEYRVPDANLPDKFAIADADFSDFRVVQGLAIPFEILVTEDGSLRNILTLSSVAINPAVSTADFDLPSGGAQ